MRWALFFSVALSPDPITFVLGVAMLTIGKQLQATKVGHAVLHGGVRSDPR